MKKTRSLRHLQRLDILVTVVRPGRWALIPPQTELHNVRSVLMFFISLVLCWLTSTVQHVKLLNGRYLLYFLSLVYQIFESSRFRLSEPCNQHAYPNTSPIRYLESALLPELRQFISYLISDLIIFCCRLAIHCTRINSNLKSAKLQS